VPRGDGAPDADFDRTVTFAEADAYVAREMRFRASQRGGRRSALPGRLRARTVDSRGRGAREVGLAARGIRRGRVEGRWWRAQVIEVDGSRPKVHYLGFEASWDEWVERARVRAPQPIDARVGEAVEIEWKGRFWPGRVVAVADDFARVHYDDYGPEWDEWVTAKRLRPPPK
jgi:hypothetical protein